MIVMEALGARLVVEPYLADRDPRRGSPIVLGGTEAQRNILLPRIVKGSMKLAFALGEPGIALLDSTVCETTARQEGGQWIINGRKSVVLHGAAADLLIVSARTSGAVDERTASRCSSSIRPKPALSGRDYPTYDGMRAAEVEFRQRARQHRNR